MTSSVELLVGFILDVFANTLFFCQLARFNGFCLALGSRDWVLETAFWSRQKFAANDSVEWKPGRFYRLPAGESALSSFAPYRTFNSP